MDFFCLIESTELCAYQADQASTPSAYLQAHHSLSQLLFLSYAVAFLIYLLLTLMFFYWVGLAFEDADSDDDDAAAAADADDEDDDDPINA